MVYMNNTTADANTTNTLEEAISLLNHYNTNYSTLPNNTTKNVRDFYLAPVKYYEDEVRRHLRAA